MNQIERAVENYLDSESFQIRSRRIFAAVYSDGISAGLKMAQDLLKNPGVPIEDDEPRDIADKKEEFPS